MTARTNKSSKAKESARINALRSYNILDTEAEDVFDQFTSIAAELCGTPIALISLLDESRQWFKSRHGLEQTETPRDIAFCNVAIEGNSVLEVSDAALDPQFRENPLVTGATKFRFYAGAPLTTSDGHNLGTLCVIDQEPRVLTASQKAALHALARSVVLQMDLKQSLQQSESARHDLAKEMAKRSVSEQKQKRAEEFLRNILNALDDHIAIINNVGEIVFVNDAWEKFGKANTTDYKSHIYGAGKNYIEVCSRSAAQGNNDAGIVLRAIGAVLKEGSQAFFRHEYACHSEAEKRWFIVSVALLEIGDEKFVAISHHNITTRMAVEIELSNLNATLESRVANRTEELSNAYASLRVNEEKYRSLFESATVGFSVASKEGYFEEVNTAFCAMTRRGRNELVGRRIESLVYADDVEKHAKSRTDVLEGRSLGFVEDLRLLRSDGSLLWGRCSVGAIRGEDGRPNQTMTLVQDITAHRKAEIERDQFFSSSVDMFAVIRFNGEILQANPACMEAFGLSEQQAIGMSIADFTHAEDLLKAQEILEAMSKAVDDVPSLEIRMRIKNGEYRDIRWTGARHNDGNSMIVVGRDITKARNAERALHRLATRLQDIREEERTRISREIHDELGQILTALKIDLDLLNRDVIAIGDEQMSDSVKSIIELVNSTLTSVKRIAQDLRPEILDALGLVPALEWQAKETHARTGLDCEIVCKSEVPPLDSNQTTQLFRIIQESLTNVVRHAEATYVRILLESVRGEGLKITIQDDGKGFNVIEAESQSLGMLGMKERARSIGATISFDSVLEKGTSVTIKLSEARNPEEVD